MPPVQWSTIASIVAIYIMKVINQFTTFQFDQFNSNQYHSLNGTCIIKEPAELREAPRNPAMYVFHFGYILSVVGGVATNTRLGFRYALTTGGVLMTVAVGLMACSYWFGFICQPAVYILTWILYPLYMGLILPCLFYGFVCWSRGPRSRMVLVVLYYYSADAEDWLYTILGPWLLEHLQQSTFDYLSAVSTAVSLLFVFLSIALVRDRPEKRCFELPTVRRLVRCLKILAVFTLFAIQLYDGHFYRYRDEILVYSKNATENLTRAESNVLHMMQNTNVPRLASMAFKLCACIGFLIVGACKRIPLASHEIRVQVGIVAATGVTLVCALVDFVLVKVGPVSPIPTAILFSSAACLDGVAEIFTMVAAYEFIDLIAQREHKMIVVGIALSIWSLASLLRHLIINPLVYDVILATITRDSRYYYCANHALNAVLLLTCFVYTRLISLPMSFTLIQQDEEETEEEMDQIPLLSAAS